MLGFTENLGLKFKSLTPLLGYFQQDNNKIEVLTKGLETRLLVDYFDFLSRRFPNFSKSSVLKLAIVGGNCSAAAHCIFRWCFACGYSFFLTCTLFPTFLHVIVDLLIKLQDKFTFSGITLTCFQISNFFLNLDHASPHVLPVISM